MDRGEALDRAWSLKAQAYDALHSDPAAAAASLDELTQLAARPSLDEPTRREIAAVRDWIDGALCVAHGRMADAVDRLDAAQDGLLLVGRSTEAAATQVPKLTALVMLGRHEAALECGRSAGTRLLAAGDEAAAGRIDLNLAGLLLHLHRHDEAAASYRLAAVRFARAGDTRHSVLADVGLATTLTWQYDFEEAERLYDRASQRIAAHRLHLVQGIVDANRGQLDLHRGRYESALGWLNSALTAFEREGESHRLADARRALADAYLALNLLPEAVVLYDRAIDAARHQDAPVEQAWAMTQRAKALARSERTEEAAQALRQAHELFEVHGNIVGRAVAELALAQVALARKAPDLALVHAARAVPALTQAGVRGWVLEAYAFEGEALRQLSRFADAESCFTTARDAACDLPDVIARCDSGLGSVRLARGDREGARASFQRAVDGVEAQRRQFAGDEIRAAYGADRLEAHHALVAMALDDTDDDAARRLMTAMEQARSRALRLAVEGTDQPAVTHREREVLRWLSEQWRQAMEVGDGSRASELRRRLDSFQARSATLSDDRSTTFAGRFDIEALQQSLPDEEAMVAYTWLDGRLAACVVSRRGIARHEIDPRGLAERIERLRFQIDTLRFGARLSLRHADQASARATSHLQALHDQIWAPLRIDATRVIVLPHRELHYVPFCALHDGRSHLVEHLEFSLAPSAAVWLRQRGRSLAAPRSASTRALVVGVSHDALPHVAREVSSVAACFNDARTLVEAQATRRALSTSLDGVDVLHVACHGQFRADSPGFSSLSLHDGELTLHEASTLPLRARLVVLSACETGMSRVAPGDEQFGLVRGFMMAGASTVVATHWSVADDVTAELMANFHRTMAHTDAPARALRMAQCGVLERHQHPYFWAPFAVYGVG